MDTTILILLVALAIAATIAVIVAVARARNRAAAAPLGMRDVNRLPTAALDPHREACVVMTETVMSGYAHRSFSPADVEIERARAKADIELARAAARAQLVGALPGGGSIVSLTPPGWRHGMAERKAEKAYTRRELEELGVIKPPAPPRETKNAEDKTTATTPKGQQKPATKAAGK